MVYHINYNILTECKINYFSIKYIFYFTINCDIFSYDIIIMMKFLKIINTLLNYILIKIIKNVCTGVKLTIICLKME